MSSKDAQVTFGKINPTRFVDSTTFSNHVNNYEADKAAKDKEINDARGGKASLKARLDDSDQQIGDLQSDLSDVIHLNIEKFVEPTDTTYDTAIQRALASVTDGDAIELKFPRGKYKLNAVVTRRKNLNIIARGAEFIPQSNTSWMWTHFGENFFVEGCKVQGETVDTFRGFKVMNDATTLMSNYAHFKDMVMENLYQGIEFYMESGIGGANYRHKLQNVRVRNATVNGNSWVGSFGIRFGGNTNSDAAGNDSKLIDVFIKGYENNLIVEKSVGTKLVLCSLDGGKNAIKYDGGQGLSLHECYLEYNTNIFEILNTPYRLNIFGGSIANYTTISTGNLYNGEPINYIGDSPSSLGISIQSTLVNDTAGRNTLIATKEVIFDLREYSNKLSFKRMNNNNISLEAETLNAGYDFGINIKTKKLKVGDIVAGTVAEFDSIGNVYPRVIKPFFGTPQLQLNTINPYIDKSQLYYTANTVATAINNLRSGSLGMRVAIKVNDTFTTFVNSANLKTKTGGTITPTLGQVLEFGMFEDGVWTQII